MDTSIFLEGLEDNNITSILDKWKELNIIKKQIEEAEDVLKTKVRNFLKEKRWDKYLDSNNNISVSITKYEQTSLDKDKLKLLLNENQIASISTIKIIEKMLIMTPESREKANKFIKQVK